MQSPNAPLEPLLARSGEIAPFQITSDGSVTTLDWIGVEVLGLSSYQRSSAPPPPKTACAVQIAIPCPGSVAATAASKRPSSVSSKYELPFSGASAGIE